MIIGFSRHGTGAGHGPVSYLTDPDRPGRTDHPPVIVRGDAEQTGRLIDALSFQHKYTSGVLSFAPGEIITPEMEQTIMDDFERLAFAGLDQDRYNILWVRHSHAGHHELHFLTPRVELATGKSLNIRPPGKRTQQQFDDLRSEVNARYGLADPNDPDRARTVSSPNHELKIAAEALRKGEKAPDNMRELIDAVLTQRAVTGLVRDRKTLLREVHNIGLEVPRAGKTYITVKDPHSNARWRLKGPLYEENYTSGRTLEAAGRERKRDYSRPDERAARHFAERVGRHHATRAEYHQERYRTSEPKFRMAHPQEPASLAMPGRIEPLGRYLGRELGHDALSLTPDQNHGTDRPNPPIPGREDQAESLRGEALRSDGRDRPDLSGRLPDIERGMRHDGAGNNPAERIGRLADTIRQTTEDMGERAERFAGHVQRYTAEQRRLAGKGGALKRAGQFLEQIAFTIRDHLTRKKNQNKPSRSTGPRPF